MKNVELRLISSAFGLACSGAAPPTRRASETVGSNFFLKDQRLSASFKKGGFDALSAEAPACRQGRGAESATPRRFSSLYWLALANTFRTFSWLKPYEPIGLSTSYLKGFLQLS